MMGETVVISNPLFIGDGVCDYANHNEECNFDGEDCSHCMTNGGASPNVKCIFPFFFVGRNQTTCVWGYNTNEKPWCSTLVDANGKHVGGQGKWGNCGPGCPIPPDNRT